MPNKLTRRMVEGAMIAALYVALTYFSRLLGLADGAVQFRLSELLTVLPAFTPAAVSGLTIGCLIANLGSPYGIADIISGTVATFWPRCVPGYCARFACGAFRFWLRCRRFCLTALLLAQLLQL